MSRDAHKRVSMAKKTTFRDVAKLVSRSLHTAAKLCKDGSFIYEDGEDVDSGLIGRIVMFGDVCFWLVLYHNCDYRYLGVALLCPIDEDYAQSLQEVNKANDELIGVKATYDAEEHGIMLVHDINLKVVGDNVGVAVLEGARDIVTAVERIRKEKLLKGIIPFLNTIIS